MRCPESDMVTEQTTLAPVRADTLPENVSYHDRGCDVAPSCLRCPLPVCKYDDPGWLSRLVRRSRDRAVIAARRREGMSVADLAERFGLSARTIHRIIQNERSGALHRESLMPDIPVRRLRRRSFFRTPAPLPPIRPGIIRERRAEVVLRGAA